MSSCKQTPIEMQDGVGIIRWKGALTVQNVDAFRKEVADWFAANPEAGKLVMDLSETDLMDSSGLGGTLAVFKQAHERPGGGLRLAAMSQKVRLLFEITKAHDLMPIHDSVDEAIAAFGA